MEKLFYFVSQEWALVGVLIALLIAYFFYNSLHKAKKKTAQQVVFAMNQGENLFLLDIRESKDFYRAHIAGSVNYPAKTYDDIKDKMAHYEGKQIVVICYAGVSAEPVATGLLDNGIESYVLEGGMENWIRLGFPLGK